MRPIARAIAIALSLCLPVAASAGGKYSLRHSFDCTVEGCAPHAALVLGTDGLFYGTTQGGGSNARGGTVFKMTASGQVTTLHSFPGTFTTIGVQAPLVQSSDGKLYGTTYQDGNYGSVFSITPAGEFTTLHSFVFTDGAGPVSGLVESPAGVFYGTTTGGGGHGLGTVYRITAAGQYNLLHSFSGSEGSRPQSELALGPDGNFYGTALSGGAGNGGTVFRMTPDGAVSTVFSFTAATGSAPVGGLLLFKGNFYGTTTYAGPGANCTEQFCGTLFKLTPSGGFTLLHAFNNNGVDGMSSTSTLVPVNGMLYGTTRFGGAAGLGTVFSAKPSGSLKVLHSFTGATTDGDDPIASLCSDGTGYLYGTTFLGGVNNVGTAFRLRLK